MVQRTLVSTEVISKKKLSTPKKLGITLLIILGIIIVTAIATASRGQQQKEEITKMVQEAIHEDFPNATDVKLKEPDISEGYETVSSLKEDIATVDVSMTIGSEKKYVYY